MSEPEPRDDPPLPAGDFSAWLVGARAAIAGEGTSDVPCGPCTACCRSSQFVHVGPDETEALAAIPPAVLFPAPFMPEGHRLMGHDERGHCPMLVDDRCSIYAARPRACRAYDCRVLPAAGVEVEIGDDSDKAAIGRQARRWRFAHLTLTDRVEHDAVQAAAAMLVAHPEVVPGGVPLEPSPRAVLAIAVHDLFLARDERTGEVTLVAPDLEAVRVEVRRRSDPAP